MITFNQWIQDEERRSILAAALNTPAVQDALMITLQHKVPTPRHADDPAHITTLYALDHSYLMGWHGALSFFQKLASMSPKPQPKVGEPWAHKRDDTSKTTNLNTNEPAS